MSKKSNKKIVWFDDRDERLKQLTALRRALSKEGFDLEGVLCDFDDVSEAIKEIGKHSPKLVIVDQFLNCSPSSAPQKGTAWAQILRESVGAAALVGTTGDQNFRPDDIQEYLFIDWFPADGLIDSSCAANIAAIANGYESLWKSHKIRKHWIDLLSPPKSQIEFLEATIPSELQSTNDESKPHIFGRWIWNCLLKLPGFTYDALELSTALGLKETGLKKIYSKLNKFKYDGIFSSQSMDRWWVADALDFIRSQVENGYSGSMQDVGRQYALAHKCKSEDFSENYNTDRTKVIPDCVAYLGNDAEKTARVPIDRASTVVMKSFRSPLGFQELRVVKPI